MARIHLYVAAACAVVLALAAPAPALAGDPDLLQDVCVADLASRKSTTPKIFVTEHAAAG